MYEVKVFFVLNNYRAIYSYFMVRTYQEIFQIFPLLHSIHIVNTKKAQIFFNDVKKIWAKFISFYLLHFYHLNYK